MGEPGKRKQPKKGSEAVSPAFTEIIGRALTDEQFRTKLFEDRDAALKGHQLAASDLEALDSIPREQLEEQARRFDRGGATATRVDVVVKTTF